MKNDEKREGRIRTLYNRALQKKYQTNGNIDYQKIVDDAVLNGVSMKTAREYANDVITKLKKGGHVR